MTYTRKLLDLDGLMDEARVKTSEVANIIKELKAEMTRLNKMYYKKDA